MFIYAISFFVSVLLLFCTEVDRKNKLRNIIFIAIALMIPIVIAGLRMVGVGTDTRVYVYNLAQVAKESTSFFEYLGKNVFITYKYEMVADREIGYNLLVYFSTKLFGSVQGVFLITHVLIIIFIYSGIKKLNLNIPISFTMCTFLCMFYGNSLNAMRQWIAIAILVFGFHYVVKNENIKYFFIVLVACTFHKSAVIGLIIWMVYKYFNNDKKHSKRYKYLDSYKLFILTIFGIGILLSISVMGELLSLLGPSFARYVNVYLSGIMQISIMQIVRRLPIIFLIIASFKKMKMYTKIAPFLCSMYIFECLTAQLSSLSVQSGRIGYYFSVFDIILYPVLIKSQKKNIKKVVAGILLLYVIAVFFYEYVYQGWSEVVPYRFFFR